MTKNQAPPQSTAHPDCLVEKFAQYQVLTGAEALFLSMLQSEEQQRPRGAEIITQGRASEHLYVLRWGWAHSYKILGNGQRQVLEFLLPGDFLGMREFAFNEALNYVTLASDSVVCPFPRKRIGEMFEHFPKLSGTLVEISTREQAILVERIVNIGCRSAYQRIAHQMLESLVRLRAVGLTRELVYDLPMSQTVLADALGLSTVHVNRTLRRLREDGLLRTFNGSVEILDLDRLIEAAEFEPYYLKTGEAATA